MIWTYYLAVLQAVKELQRFEADSENSGLSDEDTAQKLGWTVEKLHKTRQNRSFANTISMTINEEEANSSEFDAPTEPDLVEKSVEMWQNIANLDKIPLTERERQLISWLLIDGMMASGIADLWGVSHAMASHVLTNLCQKLHDYHEIRPAFTKKSPKLPLPKSADYMDLVLPSFNWGSLTR